MIKKLIVHISLLISCLSLQGQSNITFRHLNTSDGLSYLGVVDMCTDKKGNLWIGTGNGLNMYNGKTVEKYFATEYPQLQSSNIIHVACDSNNRVWVLTVNGNLTIIDEKRKFHRVGLYEDSTFIKTRWILESQQGNLILFTSNGHYMLTPEAPLNTYDSLSIGQFTKLEINGLDSLHQLFYKQVFYYDDDHYLFVKEEAFYKVDYKTRRFEHKYDFAHCTVLTKMEGDSLMVFDRESREVKIIDLVTSTITYPFRMLSDQYQIPANTTFSFAEKIKDQQYILTSRASGVFIYDHRAHKIFNHRHHYADPSSISANFTTTLEVNPAGWVFITCNPAGISYFNSREIVNNQEVFLDERGTGYDGYVAGIATTDNQTYYIGTGEGLLEWNRNTNTTHFINFKDKDGLPLPSPQEIMSIVIDNKDHIWATTATQGVVVFDKQRKLVRHITHTGDRKYALKMERVNRLVIGPDNFIWANGKTVYAESIHRHLKWTISMNPFYPVLIPRIVRCSNLQTKTTCGLPFLQEG